MYLVTAAAYGVTRGIDNTPLSILANNGWFVTDSEGPQVLIQAVAQQLHISISRGDVVAIGRAAHIAKLAQRAQ